MATDYIVKPVHKALQVLLHLSQAQRPLTLTEICYQMRLPKTTVFRYLHTLAGCGFVAHDAERDQYALGMRLWELGQLVGANLPIREVALPFMHALRDRFNETVNLAVLDGKDIVYIEMAESRHALRMQAKIGGRDPVYSTSLGKAMLAFLPDDMWPMHLPARLTGRTANTLSSLAALRHDLLLTRERGYALDHGENEEGSYCVGAPIHDQRATAIAALSVSAPASRMHASLREDITAAVMSTALQISQRFGYSKT